MKINTILDVDTGIDDAAAIMLALGYKNAKINLISCCYGNTSVENTTQNTLNFLNLIGKVDIPVVMGASKPVLYDRDSSISAHGKTGLGDYKFKKNDLKPIKGSCVEIMRDVILNTKGKTTIIALAPLTNVAKLLFAYPEIKKKIKQVVISGGLLQDDKKHPYIGFNVAQDSYAVEYVFNSGVKTVICPSDMGHQTVFVDKELDYLATLNSSGKIFREIIRDYRDRHVPDGFLANHDGCAVACVFSPKLFKFEKRYVFTRKIRAKGKSIIDFDAKLKKKHIKCLVATKINIEKFKKEFINAWKKMP